jgi:hypothetical protein
MESDMYKLSLLALVITGLLSTLGAAQSVNEHEAAIQTLLKDEKAAREYVEEIQSDAEHSPYQISTYLTVSRQFFVWKISPYDARNILNICADAAAAVNAQDSGFAILSYELGGLWGKKSAEVYGAISTVDRIGIPLWEMLSQRTGWSEDKVKDMAIKDRLNAHAAADMILKTCSIRYGGTARKIWDAQQKER